MPLSLFKDFKEFAVKGNMIDMAVGIMIGGAFATVVGSLVNDVLMPPLGVLAGGMDFGNLFVVLQDGAETSGPYASLAAAQEAGAVTLNYGSFVNSIISFLIIAWAIFMVVKVMTKIRRRVEHEEERPEVVAEPAPSQQEVLLTEIRDLLKTKN
ncbi:MAG: large conductance mechanosensitive channel protein MscL [Verrucomicrobiales bacterium]